MRRTSSFSTWSRRALICSTPSRRRRRTRRKARPRLWGRCVGRAEAASHHRHQTSPSAGRSCPGYGRRHAKRAVTLGPLRRGPVVAGPVATPSPGGPSRCRVRPPHASRACRVPSGLAPPWRLESSAAPVTFPRPSAGRRLASLDAYRGTRRIHSCSYGSCIYRAKRRLARGCFEIRSCDESRRPREVELERSGPRSCGKLRRRSGVRWHRRLGSPGVMRRTTRRTSRTSH